MEGLELGKLNKMEQVAHYLFEQKKPMTAKQVYEAGFRFQDGEPTTIALISARMCKLHESACYSVEREYTDCAGPRMLSVAVKAILATGGRKSPEPGPAELGLWRQVLRRRPGSAPISLERT